MDDARIPRPPLQAFGWHGVGVCSVQLPLAVRASARQTRDSVPVASGRILATSTGTSPLIAGRPYANDQALIRNAEPSLGRPATQATSATGSHSLCAIAEIDMIIEGGLAGGPEACSALPTSSDTTPT